MLRRLYTFFFRPKIGFLFLRKKHRNIDILFFAALFLIGIFFLLVYFYNWVLPEWQFKKNFDHVSCKIIDKKFVESKVNGIISIRPLIFIEYKIDDKTYQSWAYDELALVEPPPIGIETRESVEKILDAYVPEKETTCWVSLTDPNIVLLVRSAPIWGWFFLMIPVALLAIGSIGLWLTLKQHRFSKERLIEKNVQKFFPLFGVAKKHIEFPAIPDVVTINDSPGAYLSYRLPTSQISVIRVVASIGLCVFWNVVTWSILASFLLTDNNTHVSVASLFFICLFCLIGIALIVWVIHQAIIAFGMGATLLEISDHPILPGRTYRLHLTQMGAFRFKRFVVSVICEEVARFRQGTDTITNRLEVFRKELFVKTDFETVRDIPLQEEMLVFLPHGVMHSFFTEYNEICWQFIIEAEIAGWTDLKRECPVVVRPSAIAHVQGNYDF